MEREPGRLPETHGFALRAPLLRIKKHTLITCFFSPFFFSFLLYTPAFVDVVALQLECVALLSSSASSSSTPFTSPLSFSSSFLPVDFYSLSPPLPPSSLLSRLPSPPSPSLSPPPLSSPILFNAFFFLSYHLFSCPPMISAIRRLLLLLPISSRLTA